MNAKTNTAAAIAVAALSSITVAALSFGIGSDSMAGDYDMAQWAAVNTAKISLNDAIGLAEKEAGGHAVEAEVEQDGDRVFYYEVEVVAPDGGEKEVLIDMNTGEIIKIEDD